MARKRKTILEELDKLKESECSKKDDKMISDEKKSCSEETETEMEPTDEEITEEDLGLEEAKEESDDSEEDLETEVEDKEDEAEEGLDDAEADLETVEDDDSDLTSLNDKLDDIIASINALKDSIGNEESEESSEETSEEGEESEEGNAVDTKEGEEESLYKEDFSPLFSEEATLSEDFKSKANLVFNAVLTEKVQTITEKLAAKSEKEVNKKTKKLMETVLEDVNDYFEYLSEQWMEENKLAVELGIRNNLVENVLFKFKKALAESYIDLPDEDLTLIEELNARSKSMKKQVDSVLAENIKLKKQLIDSSKVSIQAVMSEGLNSLESDKFKKLAKAVDFENAEQYQRDLKVLKETVSRKVSKDSKEATQQVKETLRETSNSKTKSPVLESSSYLDISSIDPTKNFADYKHEEVQSPISAYVESLSRIIKVNG